MLDGAGDQVAAAGGLERLGGTAHGEVVGLGAPAGEHDLGGVAADQGGSRRAGLVEGRFGLLSEVVNARGIAEDIAADAHDGFDRFSGERGRRVVVKVDTHSETFILALGANSR